MKKPYTILAAIVILVILAISVAFYYSAPKPSPKVVQTLVLGTTLDVTPNLDPGQNYLTGVLNLNNVVFDPLYEVPPGIYPNAYLAPRLAAGDPTVSADGLHWTIPLRQGVKFQDGTAFNSTAVKYSFDRLSSLKSYSSWLLSSVSSVDVVDTYTVRMNLKYPNAALKGALTMPVAGPVSPSSVQRMGLDAFGKTPVGTGPFKYVEWVPGDHVTLAPYTGYWNQSRAPKVILVYKIFADSATMKLAIQKGEIDSAWDNIRYSDFPSLLTDPNIKHVVVTEGYYELLTLNMGIPGSPLQDLRVRQAVAYSIDQNEISRKVFQGIFSAANDTLFVQGQYPKPSWSMYTPTNIAKAKQLLTAAGYPNGVDITIWFTNVIVGSPDVEALIQEQLARSGIRAKLNSQETGAFYSRFRGGEFESAVGQMSADYLDADSTASFIAASTGSYAKRVRLNDTMLDNLVKQGVATTDPAQRAKIYGDIQDRLAALCVYVPIVNILDLWFYRNNVSGVQSYYFQYSPWWTLDKSAPAS